MAQRTVDLPVALAVNGFCPRAFGWHGRTIRVLGIEGVGTFGAERRYLVRTAEGHFQLEVCTDLGTWRIRRGPSWLGRIWASWQNAPRYSLPFWRRRARRKTTVLGAVPVPIVAGGNHADGLALV
jgi:hypothetical protein